MIRESDTRTHKHTLNNRGNDRERHIKEPRGGGEGDRGIKRQREK